MKRINNIIDNYFIIIILYLYICSILYSYYVIDIDFIANTFKIFGLISLILYIINSILNKEFKIWNIIFLILSFCLYLSYYYAFDQKVALNGYYGGREGLFVILSYYSIFLLSTTRSSLKLKKTFITILTIIGICNVIYGIFQVFNIEYIFNIPVARKWSSASGLFLNPDFLGTYLVIMFSIWMPQFILKKDKLEKLFPTYIILLIFILGIFLCGTMGSFITSIFLILLCIIYKIFKDKKEAINKIFIFKIIILIISSILLFLIISNYTKSNIKEDINNLTYEIKETINGNIESSFGTGRIYIWKEALKYYPKYFYTGIGIDNFVYLGFNDNTFIYDSPEQNNIIYKAHNEFIQILVTEGIFTFITYIIFLLLILIISIKKIYKEKTFSQYSSLIFVFIGYLIQSLFNIRIILIAPIFFILIGFLVNESTKQTR